MNKKTNVSRVDRPQSAKALSDKHSPELNQSPQQQPQAMAQNQARSGKRNLAAESLERIASEETPRLSYHLPELLPDLDSIPGGSRKTAAPRVMMLGLRGIPDVQGGVEKHVEMLGQELVARGWDVDVIGRNKYLEQKTPFVWRGIRVVPLWAPTSMRYETIVNSFLGVCHAAVKRPDILHIHAVGPGLMAPLARLLGLKVVVTHHGYDYDREKWGPTAKRILRLGERLGMYFANASIAVSRDVARTMKKRYRTEMAHIPNGVTVKNSIADKTVLDQFGLERRRYIVLVARMVPEKRQTDLIAAFAKLNKPGWKLVLVGGADHRGSVYARQVETMALRVPDVVLTGFQTGEKLATLFSQAGLFVLPSTHEGMPISLLEAMSYGLPVLASDIPANHEVDLPAEDYFPVGNIDALTAAIARKIAQPFEPDVALFRISDTKRCYAWSSISQSTIAVYRSVMPGKSRKTKP